MSRKRPAVPMVAVWVAAIVIAVAGGSVVGVNIGKMGRDTVNGYSRVPAPGAGTVVLAGPGTYLAYYEVQPPDYSYPRPDFPVTVMVTDARGVGVPVSQSGPGKQTESNGRHAGVAVASFTVTRSGVYHVTVATGEGTHPADVAIGQEPGLTGVLVVGPPFGDTARTLLLLAVLSLACVGLGLARLRGYLVGSGRSLRRQLAAWSLAGPGVDEVSVATGVVRCWARLSGASMVGIGAGMGLATVVLALSIQLTARTWFDTPGMLAALYIGLLLGGPVGYGIGAAEIRRSARGGAMYADLRPRRPDDYVSRKVRWLGAMPAAVLGLLTVVVVAHRTPPLDQLLQLGLLLATMALTLVVAELLLARVVAVPRLVVTPDPDASRLADDMLRSQVVVSVEATTAMAMGALGILAVARIGEVVGGWLPDGLLFGMLFGCVLLLNLGVLMWASAGRLGGDITGWPWSPAVGRPANRESPS